MTPDELAQIRSDTLAEAAAALARAVELGKDREVQLQKRIEGARITLAALQTEQAKVAPTSAKELPASFAQASDALKRTCELIDAAWIEGKVGNPTDEWKECRATIDRCDKLIVDLRKTAVGFIVAVVGASTYIFNDVQRFSGKSSVLCLIVLLIAVLYFIDLAHQSWLETAVDRAKQIEGSLGFALTNQIGANFTAAQGQFLGFALYSFLLATTCGVFWFSIPLTVEPLITGHRGTIYGAFSISFAAMVFAFLKADHKEKAIGQPLRGLLYCLSIGLVAVFMILGGIELAR